MTLLIFLVVLSGLVLVHELGHYLAARLMGVKAVEFGLGFPPRMFGYVKDRGRWKFVGPRDATEYKRTVISLNWLPFGGFVKLKGEDADGLRDPDSLAVKPVWKRFAVVAAGVAMNWLLAAFLFFVVFSIGTTTVLDSVPAGARIADRAVMVVDILPKSPADQSGIQPGDVVISIDGATVQSRDATVESIRLKDVSPMVVRVRRDGNELSLNVAPRMLAEVGRPAIGVALADVGTVSFPPDRAAVNAVTMAASMTRDILFALGGLVRDLFVGKVAPEVSGPVGIAVMTGRVARQGFMALLEFMAVLSVNLAVINFLPIPALDGGRALFLILEKIRRKPVSARLEIGIHNVAFILLILLILLVTARDLFRYGGVIVDGLKGVAGM